LKYFLLVLTCVLLSLNGNSQIIQRQTTSSTGSSEQLTYGDLNLTVHYSVGQASVIGNNHKNRVQLRQGFIQPLSAKVGRISNHNSLDARVFPNPFLNSFTIELPESLSADIKVVDLMGRVLFQTHVDRSVLTEITLDQVSSGTYIVLVNSSGKTYKGQIIKL